MERRIIKDVVFGRQTKIDATVALVSLFIAAISSSVWKVASHDCATHKTKLHVSRPTPGFHDIIIQLDAGAWNALRNTPRKDVDGVLVIKGLGRVPAKLHLKGRGSFQTIDDKPNFTCKPRYPVVGANGPIAGTKFHLHNSVQDPSLIADSMARKIYGRFGIPAGQLAFAKVSLNGRPLGLYTLTEGIGRPFLASHYGVDSGRLIEGENGNDVPSLLCQVVRTFSSNQIAGYAGLLDPDDLRRIIAAESLCANRDGYVFAINNYWIYQARLGDSWRIFPHTSDGAFSFAETAPRMVPVGSLATDLLTDESQRKMVLNLLAEQIAPEKTRTLFKESSTCAFALVDAVAARMPHEAQARCRAVSHLLKRLTNNVADIQKALQMERGEMDFTEDFKTAGEWQTKVGNPDGRTRYDFSRNMLTIRRATKIPRATLECPILLRPGRYKLSAWVYCETASSQTSPVPEASIGLRNLGSITNLVYGRWSAVEATFSVPDRFYGRLFHLEATYMVLNVNNFCGRISIDLGRTRLERLANSE